MFTVRLEEHPLPTSRDDVDQQIKWLIETFGFIRRRGEAYSDGDRQQPVYRILRDYFFTNPNK